MSKSKLDILVERRVLTEKYSIASMAIDAYIQAQPGRFYLANELDTNKLYMISFPSDKEVDVYVLVLIKSVFLHRNLVDDFMKSIRLVEESAGPKKASGGLLPLFAEDFKNNYKMFAYKSTLGGSTVLHSVLNNTLMGFLTIEALKIEKQLLDYGK